MSNLMADSPEGALWDRVRRSVLRSVLDGVVQRLFWSGGKAQLTACFNFCIIHGFPSEAERAACQGQWFEKELSHKPCLKFSATRGNRSISQNLRKIKTHGIIWCKTSILTVLGFFLFGFSLYCVFLGQVDEAKPCSCCRE